MSVLDELEADLDNRELLAVLGDELQEAGDPRGELIVLDLAASTDPAALARRRELTSALTPKLAKTDRRTFGVGYLRRLEIDADLGTLAKRAELLAHPSCRLLHTFECGTRHDATMTIDGALLPRSLRKLVVKGRLSKKTDLGALPFLEHLELDTAASAIASTTVRTLVLDSSLPETLAVLAPEQLPAVTKLAIVRFREPGLIDGIVKWLPRLRELELRTSTLFGGDVVSLARGLAGRKLARLVVHARGVAPRDRAELVKVCDELDFASEGGRTVADAVADAIEHTGKPEWGRGTIVREYDGKLEIAFEHGGTRTLKADAPFLRRVR